MRTSAVRRNVAVSAAMVLFNPSGRGEGDGSQIAFSAMRYVRTGDRTLDDRLYRLPGGLELFPLPEGQFTKFSPLAAKLNRENNVRCSQPRTNSSSGCRIKWTIEDITAERESRRLLRYSLAGKRASARAMSKSQISQTAAQECTSRDCQSFPLPSSYLSTICGVLVAWSGAGATFLA